MTDHESNRQRGVTVYPLHKSAYEGQGTFDKYVLGVNETTGEVYLIQVPEGVGYTVNHNKPWRFNDYNVLSKFHTVLEVLDLADYSQPRDLADCIRSFGARLESNFSRLAYALTTDKADQPDYNEEVGQIVLEVYKEAVMIAPVPSES